MREKFCEQIKEKIEALIPSAQVLHYKKGQILFYEGHDPYGLYILKRGRVLFERGGAPVSSEKHFLSLKEGQAIHIQNMIRQSPYDCTCKASIDCEFLFISKGLWQHTFESYSLPLSVSH
ncbi:MAG: cyclic nucleotide-binding domain-containing protein [Deltaproteobacteria bacterium]|nr:cyclic nucleotide-binding domain-containing protein [Deltaproteobacteria bacterium]